MGQCKLLNCKFSHNETNRQTTNQQKLQYKPIETKSKNICGLYQMGRCPKTDCKYLHKDSTKGIDTKKPKSST